MRLSFGMDERDSEEDVETINRLETNISEAKAALLVLINNDVFNHALDLPTDHKVYKNTIKLMNVLGIRHNTSWKWWK